MGFHRYGPEFAGTQGRSVRWVQHVACGIVRGEEDGRRAVAGEKEGGERRRPSQEHQLGRGFSAELACETHDVVD